MKRVSLVAAVFTLLVAAAPSPAAAAKRDRCGRAGSVTLAKSRLAWVYERGSVLYGCLRAGGRPRRLAEASDDGSTTSETYDDVALNGRFVTWTTSYSDLSCKAACPEGYDISSTAVHATDLRTGGTTTAAYEGTLFASAVTRTGGVAYLLTNGGPGEMWALDGGGSRPLDRGAIEISSLRVRGSTVLWRNGHEERSALVAGGPSCATARFPSLAWDDVGRAYERRGVLFGCTWLRARPVRLTSAPRANVQMAGRFVAWSEVGSVVVHDLLSGRVLRPPAAGAVDEVALGGNGLVAWIESRPGEEPSRRVLLTKATVPTEVGFGAVEPRSLVVRGSVVSWRQDGAERTVLVD